MGISCIHKCCRTCTRLVRNCSSAEEGTLCACPLLAWLCCVQVAALLNSKKKKLRELQQQLDKAQVSGGAGSRLCAGSVGRGQGSASGASQWQGISQWRRPVAGSALTPLLSSVDSPLTRAFIFASCLASAFRLLLHSPLHPHPPTHNNPTPIPHSHRCEGRNPAPEGGRGSGSRGHG